MAYKETLQNDVDGVPKERHIASNISSSASKQTWVGDVVAERRASLLDAQGEPKVGRRPSPEPYDPRPRRIMYLKGILAGLAVVIIVLAIVFILGANATIA